MTLTNRSERLKHLLFLKSAEQFGYWLSKEEEAELHAIMTDPNEKQLELPLEEPNVPDADQLSLGL